MKIPNLGLPEDVTLALPSPEHKAKRRARMRFGRHTDTRVVRGDVRERHRTDPEAQADTGNSNTVGADSLPRQVTSSTLDDLRLPVSEWLDKVRPGFGAAHHGAFVAEGCGSMLDVARLNLSPKSQREERLFRVTTQMRQHGATEDEVELLVTLLAVLPVKGDDCASVCACTCARAGARVRVGVCAR